MLSRYHDWKGKLKWLLWWWSRLLFHWKRLEVKNIKNMRLDSNQEMETYTCSDNCNKFLIYFPFSILSNTFTHANWHTGKCCVFHQVSGFDDSFQGCGQNLRVRFARYLSSKNQNDNKILWFSWDILYSCGGCELFGTFVSNCFVNICPVQSLAQQNNIWQQPRSSR